jgi:serine/threonine protein kinase
MPEMVQVDRFAIQRSLGVGGIGLVYEAIDCDSGAHVAIKTLRDVTPDGLYRLKREFRLLQGLEHPNVCQIYELFEHSGRWFIAMELVHGKSLLEYLRGMDGAREDQLRDAMAQLALALCAVHDAELVHRDLKPSNVLVAQDGRVVLLGEVSANHTKYTQTGALMGTPMYMAPEQALAADAGATADWYSFGVILFEALTGRLPHDGETALAVMLEKQRTDAPRASSFNPDVPADLDDLCADLLRIDPARRPSGASVLRRLGHGDRSRDSRPSLASVPSISGGFVGRSSELAQLRSAFSQIRESPMTVLVEGPSGVGKTALVREFVDEVVAQEALVLSGRCYERESVPYKAFDTAIDGLARYLRRLPDIEVAALLPRHPDLLVRLFPVLGAVPAIAAAPSARTPVTDPHEQRNQAFAALRDMLHRLSSRRRLILTIDDWQWADPDSVVLARDLVLHRDAPPILLVLTARPSNEPDSAARFDAVATPELRRISLESLALAPAIELAGQLRAAFAPSLQLDLAAIARETGGHPLYISELIRYAATKRNPEAAATVRLEEAIMARIAELPPEARAIIDVLAIAGEPIPLEIIRDALDEKMSILQRQSAALRIAHLVRSGHADGSLEPYHDRVREAVLDAMDAAARLAWHKRLASALEASPLARARPELLLWHLEAAGENARAAELASEAAHRAVSAGAFDQAASLFALALRGSHVDAQRARALRVEMGQALANAGRGAEAAEAFLDAARDAEPAIRLSCHRQAAEQLLSVGELDRGLEILRTLLGDVGVKMPRTQKSALASVVWSRAKLRLRGLRWKERRESQIAPETLLRLDVLKVASQSLALVDNIRAAAFNARWLLLALQIGESSRTAHALLTETVYQSSQGGRGVTRARALLDTVRKLGADSTEDPRLRAFLLLSEGTVEYWTCRLGRADELIGQAEAVFREETTGTNLELKSARMFHAFTLRHRGAWARLRELRERYVADAERRGDRYVITSMNRYCSALYLASDEPRRARSMVDNATWVLPTNAFHAQHWYELEARGEIALYEGTLAADLPALEPLFAGLDKSVLTRVTTVSALSLWLRGRLALHTPGADAQKLVEKSIAKLAKVDNPRAAVFASMLGAGRAMQAGDTEIAVAKLRAAYTRADEIDLSLHAAAARRQLGLLLGGSEGADHLALAEKTMTDEGVASPDRFTRWFVPGTRS